MAKASQQENARPMPFLLSNRRAPKPRRAGLTEIRGPYYTPLGPRILEDILDCAADAIDSLKFGGGAFAVMSKKSVEEIIKLCHRAKVTVSTGGFIESVIPQGRRAIEQYIDACNRLGFDTIEISSGFITIPMDDLLRLVELVRKAGLKPKPEIGIQFGAGGASSAEELSAEGIGDVSWAIERAKKFLDAGAEILMIESEGITESVKTWRSEVPSQFASALGLERMMFEAADPAVFEWYIKNFGPDVNLFVDHSQIIQLECLRCGIWGTKSTWGRVMTLRETSE
jgi:phosphosulfolactate synthase (CoM biosynthesis protein A)